jgi:hypothetical protein
LVIVYGKAVGKTPLGGLITLKHVLGCSATTITLTPNERDVMAGVNSAVVYRSGTTSLQSTNTQLLIAIFI